jgi:hypothetical protein
LSEDRPRVEQLYQNLVAAGFQPWMDAHELVPGEEWLKAIQRGIQSADCFLACISPRSIAKNGVLGDEVQSALEQWNKNGRGSKYRLIPVRLEEVRIPDSLAQLQWFDLFRDEQWTELARFIRQRIAPPAPWLPRWLRAAALSLVIAALAAVVWWYAGHYRGPRWPPGPVRVGVTVWRLREAAPSDPAGSKMLVQPHGNRGTPAELVPERALLTKPFAVGDRVRASFEAAQNGYLYIIDQEQIEGATLGPPKLIFPTMRIRGGHNEVHPGQLVETPPQEDEDPYWEFTGGNGGYWGEWLTIIFSPRAIPELGPGLEARDLDEVWFRARLREWALPLSKIETASRAAATPAEVQAGKNGSNLLTPDDPRPQTIFSGTPRQGAPLVASLSLSVR